VFDTEKRSLSRNGVLAGAERRHVLAICGGGNAGHAIAVAASKSFAGDICWLTSTDEKASLLRQGVFSSEGLRSNGVINGLADKVRVISSEPEAVISCADIVMIAVPAFAHATVLRRIAPYLKEDAVVGSLPTRGGFEFEASDIISDIAPDGGRCVFGLQTLPWSTRVQKPGNLVNFGALKSQVLMATLPRGNAPRLAPLLTQILGTQIVPTDSFLNMTLGNPGQVVHCGIMYGLFSKWTGEPYREAEIPHFYADVSDDMGAFIEGLSAEIVTVARKIEADSMGRLDLSGVLSIHEWLKISYPTQTKDLGTVASSFRTGPIQARKAPVIEIGPDQFAPNFKYRYLSEDVPYGIAVSKAMAELAGIATPSLDAILRWAEDKLDVRYFEGDKLGTVDTRSLPFPQNYRVLSLADLVDWYLIGARERSDSTASA
jgi:hypothetical protein